jgi:hypothetical protein
MPRSSTPDPEAQPAKHYRPRGTLYDDETVAAIVAGHRITFERFSLPSEQIEALERSLLAALEARGLALVLYVPGDTVSNPDMEIRGRMVLGRAIVTTRANDRAPNPVDPDRVAQALADFPPLDAAFWKDALAGLDDATPDATPHAYLLSWGPLCYAGLSVGVARSKGAPEPPVHKYLANQDMNQEWSSQGIDGITIKSTEFGGIEALSLRPADDLAKAAPLQGASYWLRCRYD